MPKRLDMWDEVRRMQDEMDSVFGRFFDFRPGFGRLDAPLLEAPKGQLIPKGFRQPLTDLYETENEVVAKVEIPGVNKEDIKVNATEDTIEIKAEKKQEKKEEKKGVYRYERSYSGFYRCMALPEKVNPDKITTSFKEGVLELKMPKAEPGKTKVKQITVQ